jgi:hypothetical protein
VGLLLLCDGDNAMGIHKPDYATRMVQAWIEIHREALLANWELAANGQPPFKIDPLR